MGADRRQHADMRLQRLWRRAWFQGWYFKQVSADEKTAICFIPGISLHDGTRGSFIQAILAQRTGEGWRQSSDWLDYPPLTARDEPFSIALDGGEFRRNGIRVDYKGERLRAEGELRIGPLTPPPASLWAPTVMGPFAYLPGMECIHSVISMNHALSGTLRINGEAVDFSGGKGYVEKDWGSSFPRRYVWLQSNHFAREGSLFFSWADIPALGTSFGGHIAHLWYGGGHHRYATYTRGSCRVTPRGNEVDVLLRNAYSTLEISAVQAEGARLVAPRRGRMVDTIKEGLFGRLSFCLKKDGEPRIIVDDSEVAGVEIVFEKGRVTPDSLPEA